MRPTKPTFFQSRSLGVAAEAAARRFLEATGLQHLASNVRYPIGELDLVMRDGSTLAFVEVRYRRHAQFGSAAESVDWRKQQKLIRAAQLYLSRHPQWTNAPCRFDVIHIDGPLHAVAIQWIQDAFFYSE